MEEEVEAKAEEEGMLGGESGDGGDSILKEEGGLAPNEAFEQIVMGNIKSC